jgi:hypothetical protein
MKRNLYQVKVENDKIIHKDFLKKLLLMPSHIFYFRSAFKK